MDEQHRSPLRPMENESTITGKQELERNSTSLPDRNLEVELGLSQASALC